MSKTKKLTVSVRLNKSARAIYTWEEFDELLAKYEQRGFIRGLRSAARMCRRMSIVDKGLSGIVDSKVADDWATADRSLARVLDRHASRLERKGRGK